MQHSSNLVFNLTVRVYRLWSQNPSHGIAGFGKQSCKLWCAHWTELNKEVRYCCWCSCACQKQKSSSGKQLTGSTILHYSGLLPIPRVYGLWNQQGLKLFRGASWYSWTSSLQMQATICLECHFAGKPSPLVCHLFLLSLASNNSEVSLQSTKKRLLMLEGWKTHSINLHPLIETI